MIYLFVILTLLYFFSLGATEGWFWATQKRRLENKIIKGGREGNGIIDYHGYRTFMRLFVLFVSVLLFGLGGLGAVFVGLFLYERVLNKVCKDRWFKENGWEYYFFGLTIKRYKWQDWLALVTGIAFLSYYLITK